LEEYFKISIEIFYSKRQAATQGGNSGLNDFNSITFSICKQRPPKNIIIFVASSIKTEAEESVSLAEERE
jgi:hypothetical protein